MRWIFLAVPIAVTPPPQMTKSLARCCGSERATLGPLFGKLAIGPLGAMTQTIVVDGLPTYLRPDKVGLTIGLDTSEGQYDMYLDGVAIEVPDHDACVALEKRLERAWGPQAKWFNATRHQRASLTWGAPDSNEPACTLGFDRVPSQNGSHCLKDEKPITLRDIDVAQHCLKPARADGCMLDRDRPHPTIFGICVADDATHAFSRANSYVGRQCTKDEEQQLDFKNLRDCP